MGRGQGGGGKGGGGGRGGGGQKLGGKGVGGGGAAGAVGDQVGLPKTGVTDPVKAANQAEQKAAFKALEGKEIFEDPQNLSPHAVRQAYKDLPDAGDGGRIVQADGSILVPETGAPNLPSKLLSDEAAYDKLARLGANKAVLNELEDAGSLREIATILPDNARIMGKPGFEGMGMDVGDGKIWRVQYRGTERPLPAYDVGKAGVYPEWEKQYGNTWITQKEKLVGNINDVSRLEVKAGGFLQNKIRQDVPSQQWNFNDMHGGNLGHDPQGRIRLLDQGAAVPQGANIVRDQGALVQRWRDPAGFAAAEAAKAAKRKVRPGRLPGATPLPKAKPKPPPRTKPKFPR